jgi:nicotinate phosphoribosyltransferase
MHALPADYALLTDLYQLTMGVCYVGEGLATATASFELFVRRLPPHFGYLIAMGLAEAIAYLQDLHFTDQHISALQATGLFSQAKPEFWQLLKDCHFQGNLWAVPEGTVIFAHEPILRIEAPLWQAQLLETYLLNTINYQTMIATKTARLRDIAGDDRQLWEFGTRRAFSPQGALWSARAALAAGMDGTSNVLAALQLGHKPVGTMAHSLVMALSALEGGELQAYQAFHRHFPNGALLIDTFDAVKAAELLADHPELAIKGVRLDSGNLVSLSQTIHNHLPHTAIYGSGDLDEWEIQRLQNQGAIMNGYGIGTKLVTGTPVNGVYKLVEINGIPVRKQSTGKQTYGYRKQIYRTYRDGQISHDRLVKADSPPHDQEIPLLQLVIEQGTLRQNPHQEPLSVISQRVRRSVTSPVSYTHLRAHET